MRYFVSGHNDSSTFDDWVRRLPIKPPPLTSQVTRQSLGEFVAVHAMFVDTNELSRTIDWTASDQVSKIDLFMLVDAVHSSQHCKEKTKLKIIYQKSFCHKKMNLKYEEKIYTVQVANIEHSNAKNVFVLLNWWHCLDCEILRTCHSICIFKKNPVESHTVERTLSVSRFNTVFGVSFACPFFRVHNFAIDVAHMHIVRSMWITHWSCQS